MPLFLLWLETASFCFFTLFLLFLSSGPLAIPFIHNSYHITYRSLAMIHCCLYYENIIVLLNKFVINISMLLLQA